MKILADPERNFTIFRDDEPSSSQDSSSFAAASTITVNKQRFEEIGSINSHAQPRL
jgi:hypothetical protein